MDLKNKTIDELISLASQTTCENEAKQLAKSVYMLVRRALARNLNTPINILEELAFDPVLNVSYMAVQNPNISIERDFHALPKCAVCQIPDSEVECSVCQHKEYKPF